MELFDTAFLNKLERMGIVAKRAFPGVLKGEKRSPRRGHSVEFADFRSYTPGDDFRHVDWNAYGRLEKLFLKLFMEEEDLHVYVLIDASKSMDFGLPSKFDFARRLAAAFGYIALTNLDRLGISSFSGELEAIFPLARGRHQAHRMFDFLQALEVNGQTNLGRAMGQWAIRHRRPGVLFLISDFFDPGGYQQALTTLQSRRFDVNVIHVLARQELEPEIRGDLRLVDSETGEAREITVSGSVLNLYRRSLEGFCQGLQRFCHGRSMGYVRTSSADDFEDLVLRQLRRGRFLK